MGVDFGYQGQLKNVFKEIAEKVEGYSGLSHNLLANEGATPVKRAQADLKKVDRAELMSRLAGDLARVDRDIPVDTSEIAAKAGSLLHKRYPLVTRFYEMISPVTAREKEVAEPLIFPA